MKRLTGENEEWGYSVEMLEDATLEGEVEKGTDFESGVDKFWTRERSRWDGKMGG